MFAAIHSHRQQPNQQRQSSKWGCGGKGSVPAHMLLRPVLPPPPLLLVFTVFV